MELRRGKAGASACPAEEEVEQLRGVQDDGVQGSRARCGRSCSAMVSGGFAREQ
jgi:hypothetical protein